MILEPTPRLDFLGFTVDTVSMELRLPRNNLKIDSHGGVEVLGGGVCIWAGLGQINRKNERDHASDSPSPLFFRHLQRDLARTLDESCENYDTHLMLSRDSREKLQWWKSVLQKWNGKSLLSKEADLITNSNAPL